MSYGEGDRDRGPDDRCRHADEEQHGLSGHETQHVLDHVGAGGREAVEVQ